ncbi:hypothetical protein [Mesoplasma photuris]|uniref:hypothetical protein n=1 Tax=Mesoplasma photuris TaxID=217731 RepID=UPI0004E246D4|nr:hypothetical protein [Mesoplasma photuris]
MNCEIIKFENYNIDFNSLNHEDFWNENIGLEFVEFVKNKINFSKIVKSTKIEEQQLFAKTITRIWFYLNDAEYATEIENCKNEFIAEKRKNLDPLLIPKNSKGNYD